MDLDPTSNGDGLLVDQPGIGKSFEPALQLGGDEPAAVFVGFEDRHWPPPSCEHHRPGDADAAAAHDRYRSLGLGGGPRRLGSASANLSPLSLE